MEKGPGVTSGALAAKQNLAEMQAALDDTRAENAVLRSMFVDEQKKSASLAGAVQSVIDMGGEKTKAANMVFKISSVDVTLTPPKPSAHVQQIMDAAAEGANMEAELAKRKRQKREGASSGGGSSAGSFCDV